MPRLSIVMPTRNQASFIEASIASVMAQADHLPAGALELVVADGASTDGTPALVAALARRHPGLLHLVSEPDRGPADAVNKAVARARGAIVGWLNSDDLYLPGAAARALAAFDAEPGLVMVYGEGEHVDAAGQALGRYPTRPPQTPIAAWADGCHICQPTAFFRRETFLSLGGLDTTLATAFDFDFWLRLLKAYPGRVRQLEAVQALSRLHADGITLRMREQVALEGMAVVHRHLGAAPPHWLLTHVGEAMARCPFDADGEATRQHLLSLAERARSWLAPGRADETLDQIRAHRAWQLLRRDFAADVHADGWAPPVLAMRLRQPPGRPYRSLQLRGRHQAPGGGALVFRVDGLAGSWQGGTDGPGPFRLDLPLPADAGERLLLRLVTSPHFVPALQSPGSDDHRALAFLLDAVDLT